MILTDKKILPCLSAPKYKKRTKHLKKTRTLLCYGLLITGLIILSLNELSFAESVTLDFGHGSISAKLIQLLLFTTVITLAPTILVMVTAFTRMVIVFSFLRTALGTQHSPPNNIIISLAFFMTLFVMAPTIEKSYEQGIKPLLEEKLEEAKAIELAASPFKEFMLHQVRQPDLNQMIDLAAIDRTNIEKEMDLPYKVVIPAFILSELRRAFEISFLMFIPFIIIDMLVASVLLSMGMMMIPPMMLSLPFKMIFFVLIDGWNLLAGSLIKGFH